MVDQAIIDEWLAKAEEDYLFVSIHLPHEETFFAIYCFHCHQAVEKYFKAFIVAKELLFLKNHDLVALWNMCMKHDRTFGELGDEARLLSRYYIDTRYPTVWPVGYTKEDAQGALDAAERVRNFIKNKIVVSR